MTMFEELYALATSATLTLTISADDKTGRMTINVIPKPKKDADEPALSTPLSLTATPAEFDEQFVSTLKDYREARQSLMEQAEATREVLEAAKAASSKKAVEAVTKAAKPAVSATPKTAAVASNADDDRHEEAGKAVTGTPQAAAATDSETYDLFG